MQELEVTWTRATKIWWSLAWRGVLFGMIAAALAGFLVGLVLGSAGNPELVEPTARITGMAVGIPIGIWVVRTVLSKEYRHYRIALVPSHEAVLESAVRDGDA